MKYVNWIIICSSIIALTVIFGCDGGLEPEKKEVVDTKGYISGHVHFMDSGETWPPRDSVVELRVVAFKNYPPGNILAELFAGNAVYSDTLELFVDSASFEIVIEKPPVEYKYIVAAQRYNDSLTAWKAIGVYSLDGNPENPRQISVESGKTYPTDIYVDFNKLPPQPF
jgi:hypothetical protein